MNTGKRYLTLTENPGPAKRPRFPSATAASARVPMNQFRNGQGTMVGKIRQELNDGHWSSARDVANWVRAGAPSTSSSIQSRVVPSNYKLFTQPLIGDAVPDAGDFLFSLITKDGRIGESIGGTDPTLQTTSTKAGSLAALNFYLMKHQFYGKSEIAENNDMTEFDRIFRIVAGTSLHGVVLNEHGTDGRETQLTNGGSRELGRGRIEAPVSVRRNGFKLAGRISNSTVDRILMVARQGAVPIKNVFSGDLLPGDEVFLVLKRMKLPAQYVLDAKPMTKNKELTPGDAMRGTYFQYTFVTVRAGKKLTREHLEYEYNGQKYYGHSQHVGFVRVLEKHARHDKDSAAKNSASVPFSDASLGRDKQMMQFALTSGL